MDADTDRGIEGVLIELIPHDWTSSFSRPEEPGEPIAATRTEAEGFFLIPDLNAGDYKLRLGPATSYPNQRTYEIPIVQVESGEKVNGLEISLDRDLTAKGRVVDTEGLPIADALMNVWNENELPQRLHTDALGRFAIYGMKPGDPVTIEVQKTGYKLVQTRHQPDGSALIVEHDGLEGIEITLRRAGYIEGTLVDELGNVLAGQFVRSENAPTISETDDRGKWTLVGLMPRTYILEVESPEGWPEGWEIVSTPASFSISNLEGIEGVRLAVKHVNLQVRLGQWEEFPKEPEYTGNDKISGYVRDREGRPIVGAFVSQPSNSDIVLPWDSATSDDIGYFELGPKTDDRMIELYVSHPKFIRGKPYFVSAGNLSVEIVLDPPVLVSGRVIDADTGEPIPYFDVSIGKGPSGTSKQAFFPDIGADRFLDPDGCFTMPSFFDGVVTVSAWAPDYAWGRVTRTLVLGTPVSGIEIRLDRGSCISGLVTDVEGRPIENATVSVAGSHRTMTDPVGRFRLEHLTPSVYELRVGHNDFLTSDNVSVDLTVEKEVRVRLSLTSAATIEGVVLCGGVPIERAEVRLFGEDLMEYGHDKWTDDEGRYIFRWLKPGHYTTTCKFDLEASKPDIGPIEFDLETGESVICDFVCNETYPEAEGECMEGEVEGEGAMYEEDTE